MDVHIIGINDRACNVPLWVKDIENSYLILSELPVTQETSSRVFSKLNDKNAEYFSSQSTFIEYMNTLFRGFYGFGVTEMTLGMLYHLKDKCEFYYPVGCIDEFEYKNSSLENIVRFNRSVAITNNIIGVLKDYEKTINLKQSEADNLFNDVANSEILNNSYKQGNKQKFLNNIMSPLFLYSGEENLTPSVAKDVLEDMINISFDGSLKEKTYINPSTFSKSFYETKKKISPEKVTIIVGEPHRLFIEYFLKKIFPQVSSESRTLDSLKTNENTPYIVNEIHTAEKENLIKF